MSWSNWSAADPNEVYSLVELLGEGSYGCVYKGGTVTVLPLLLLP